MISVRRWLATIIPLIYALYLPVQSLLLPNLEVRYLELLALALYLVSVVPSLIFYSGLRIPLTQAVLNLGAAFAIPLLIIWQRALIFDQSVGGWAVMGTAVILTVTAVRQQRWAAILGISLLAALLFLVYGPLAAITGGLIGAVVLVLAGLGVSRGTERANLEVQEYLEQESISRAQIAATTATRIERTKRVQEVLGEAVPMLSIIAELKEPMSVELRSQAKLLELSLRDEIRGRNLLTPELKSEVARLRNLGVDVAVLDEGGVDHLTEATKKRLIAEATLALQKVVSGRVTIRSPRGESFVLTVVATLPGQTEPLVLLRLFP